MSLPASSRTQLRLRGRTRMQTQSRLGETWNGGSYGTPGLLKLFNINLCFSVNHCWLDDFASVTLPKLRGKVAGISGRGFADTCLIYPLPRFCKHYKMPHTSFFLTEYSDCQRSSLLSPHALLCPVFLPVAIFLHLESVCARAPKFTLENAAKKHFIPSTVITGFNSQLLGLISSHNWSWRRE